MNTIEELAREFHDPELAKHAHVRILFEDGEFGFTKGGDLLWLRTIHIDKGSLGENFGELPVKRPGCHSCCYVTEENGAKIIAEMESQLITKGVDVEERRMSIRQNDVERTIFRCHIGRIYDRLNKFQNLLNDTIAGDASVYNEETDEQDPIELDDLTSVMEGVIGSVREELESYGAYKFSLDFEEQ